MIRHFPIFRLLLVLLLCLQAAQALARPPRVVASIVPIQEVAAALMEGIASPGVIITEQASAHHFAFRPSHMRMLQQADLVIWIDRDFESGFRRLAEVLPGDTVQLELLPALAIDTDDGHIWYSADLLLRVIELIEAKLADIDPDNAPRYRDNAAALSAAIVAWRAGLVEQMHGRQPGYLSDHAFTGHLEADLGYAPIANIHDRHDDHGGLRELGDIEERLRRRQASCLLTLETPPSPLALELARKYRLKVINLGAHAGTDSGTPAIVVRLHRLGAALLECSNP